MNIVDAINAESLKIWSSISMQPIGDEIRSFGIEPKINPVIPKGKTKKEIEKLRIFTGFLNSIFGKWHV